MKKVVVVGGGTGTFVVLSGIKKYDFDISAVVSTMDSGGSTGRLRDQYGVVPPGDLRQCLVALSQASELWRKLFLYRFDKGDFKGHNFGNIFLTALEKNTQNYQEVVDTASYILQTTGSVLPVTFDKVNLCVQYEDGEIIESESLIDTAFHKKTKIIKAYLKPKAQVNVRVLDSISNADFIIIGPGDLYTSLIPNLIVEGVKDAISKCKAEVIAVINLMTKHGQTTDYAASDHIADLESYLGKKVKYVILNNKEIPDLMLTFYKKYGEKEVEDDLDGSRTIVRRDLLASDAYIKSKSDKIVRSLLRHDSDKLAKALDFVIQQK